jgi:hypothetical protein
MDYGFGAHVKLTDLARIGIFDSPISRRRHRADISRGSTTSRISPRGGKMGPGTCRPSFGVGFGAGPRSTPGRSWTRSPRWYPGFWSFNDDWARRPSPGARSASRGAGALLSRASACGTTGDRSGVQGQRGCARDGVATKTVSSPATVPTTPGIAIESRASATVTPASGPR